MRKQKEKAPAQGSLFCRSGEESLPCCAILESMTDGVLTVDLDLRTDIPLLVKNFLDRLNAHKGKQVSGVSAEVLARLLKHSYPGNIRELENIVEHAYVLCRGTLIEERHLPHDFIEKTNRDSIRPADPAFPLDISEGNLIRETLKAQGGNRLKTARQLGLSRSTLWRKIKKHGLPKGS